MAHSVSARRFLPIVPGPHSSQFQFLPTALRGGPDVSFLFSSFSFDGLRILSRRQTLAFKGFLVSISRPPFTHSEFLCYWADSDAIFPVTIYGLVSGADTALLSHENQQRLTENDLRREARIDLARRGLVPTESQIMKWKDEHRR
jgi:hypothetical protein